MINLKKLLIIIFILVGVNFNSYSADDVFIVYKVDSRLISNIDIENEAKYLIAQNNELKNIGKKKILEISKESILKETVKKNELEKYYDLDQKNPYLDVVIKGFYSDLGLNSKNDFNNYLKDYGLNISDIKKKIEIESTWNELIFRKYESFVKIEEDKNEYRIKKEKNKKKKTYLLSEIIFKNKKDKDIIKLIENSIKEIGFANTANTYSLSDTAKFGGKIGWVNEESLSKKIYKEIVKTKIGSYTSPIEIGNTIMILKLVDSKEQIIKVNIKNRIKQIVEFETNRQLTQYSQIFYNKIKINTKISEL